MHLRAVVILAAASLLAACATSTPRSGGPEPDAAVVGGPEGRLLRAGESLSATLVESDPVWGMNGRFHLYRFTANAGDRLVIEMSSDDFDPYLVVGDKSGGIFNPIAQDDDSGGDLDARVRFVAPRGGTFWILAQAYADYGLGAYTLSLQPMPESRPATATPIAVGGTAAGTLDESDAMDFDEEKYYDLYTFQAVAGNRYAISMASGEFDTYLILGTGSGDDFSEIDRNDDSGDGTDSRIVFTPSQSGTYAVRASSFDESGTGEYTITVREMTPGPLVVTPLAIGRTVQGSLDESDQIGDDGALYDVYTFEGREGQRVAISMRSDQLDSYLELGEPVGPGEFFVADVSNDDAGGSLDSRIVTTLWYTGTYEVRAHSLYAEETGPYTLTVEELPEPGPASVTEIEPGQTVTGSLSDADAMLEDGSYYDYYTFRGRAGQRVRITLGSDDFDSYLSFGPWRGDEIERTDSDDDSGGGTQGLDAMLEVTLPANGVYGIQANSLDAGEVGAYTLTLETM